MNNPHFEGNEISTDTFCFVLVSFDAGPSYTINVRGYLEYLQEIRYYDTWNSFVLGQGTIILRKKSNHGKADTMMIKQYRVPQRLSYNMITATPVHRPLLTAY